MAKQSLSQGYPKQLPNDMEEAFNQMSEEQRRMSFCLNTKNVLTKNGQLNPQLLCSLCKAILVDPMRCKQCKNNFHKSCLNKFCRETGQCPMMCQKPRFVSIKKEIRKQLNELRFMCNNQELGCDKILSYEEAQTHELVCQFALVKCQAYKNCRSKCVRQELQVHEAVCPYIKTKCIYCMDMVPRIDISQHESEQCKGTHMCEMCGLMVNKAEIQNNTHNCFNTLAGYLEKMIGEKDQVIKMLKEEIGRKNNTIRLLIEKQASLEGRLAKLDSVLSFDSKSNIKIPVQNLIFKEEYNEDEVKEIIEIQSKQTSEDQVKFLDQVEEDYKEYYNQAFDLLQICQTFVKEQDWDLFSQSDEAKLKTKISDRKLICVKSQTIIQENLDNILQIITDLDQRWLFDDNFERGQIMKQLPLDISIQYQKWKKILIIKPREMYQVTKVFRTINRKKKAQIWVCSQSIQNLKLFPHKKSNVLRVESPRNCWMIEELDESTCKVVFAIEIDLEVSLSIQKQVAPKANHLAYFLRQYIMKMKEKQKQRVQQ